MTGPRETLRIDKWLWHIRVVKTRSLAARLCAEGRVQIGGRVVRKPSAPTGAGDRVTLDHAGWHRVLEVRAIGERRGPASEAALLYHEAEPARRIPRGDPLWTPLVADDDE